MKKSWWILTAGLGAATLLLGVAYLVQRVSISGLQSEVAGLSEQVKTLSAAQPSQPASEATPAAGAPTAPVRSGAAAPSAAKPAPTPPAGDIIGYNLDILPVEVTKTNIKTTTFVNASLLKSNAAQCGTVRPQGYFESLASSFNDKNGFIYAFKYQGETQGTGEYDVRVIPNVPLYPSLSSFKKDFDRCAPGGIYPKLVSKNWLLFVDDCPVDNGSGKPNGCALIQSVLAGSLKLNQ